MLRRFSSTFKKKGDRESKQNGTAPSSSTTAANSNNNDKRHSKIGAARKSSSDDERSEKKGDSVSPFEKYASVLHASRSPIPNQTGDGAYLEHEHTTSLLQDARHLGFKDYKTLKEVIESKLPGGQLVDDKTMLMERVIQVRRPAYDAGRLNPGTENYILRPVAGQQTSSQLKASRGTDKCFPY
jgi:linoleate 10R-lipoxygenase